MKFKIIIAPLFSFLILVSSTSVQAGWLDWLKGKAAQAKQYAQSTYTKAKDYAQKQYQTAQEYGKKKCDEAKEFAQKKYTATKEWAKSELKDVCDDVSDATMKKATKNFDDHVHKRISKFAVAGLGGIIAYFLLKRVMVSPLTNSSTSFANWRANHSSSTGLFGLTGDIVIGALIGISSYALYNFMQNTHKS